jgi:hypothetical protein
MDKQTDRWIDG